MRPPAVADGSHRDGEQLLTGDHWLQCEAYHTDLYLQIGQNRMGNDNYSCKYRRRHKRPELQTLLHCRRAPRSTIIVQKSFRKTVYSEEELCRNVFNFLTGHFEILQNTSLAPLFSVFLFVNILSLFLLF